MNPFATPNPFDTGTSYGRRPAAFPPLDDAQTDVATESLTSKALSGLGYVGSTLDKLFGGRAVRGVLGGKPQELLSALPGSDMVGLTSPEDAVSGEDLLRNIGYDPSQGDWLERNLVGPAVEVGLDPSTYLGGIGALTAAGKAAKASNTLTRGLLPGVRAGQRSLMYGLGGPAVADAASAVGGALGRVGGMGLDLAERVPALGVGVRAMRNDLVPQARSLFDHTAGPVANRTVQAAHAETFLPQRQAMEAAARQRVAGLWNQLQPVIDAGGDPNELYRLAYQRLEGVTPDAAPSLAPHAATLEDIFSKVGARNPAIQAEERAAGLASPSLASDWGLDYATRQSLSAARGGTQGEARLFSTFNPSQLQRLKAFDVPGGSMQIEDYFHDPRLAGAQRTMRRGDARQFIFDDIMRRVNAGPEGIPLAPELLDRTIRRSGQLQHILRRGTLLQPGETYWAPDFLQQHLLREQRSARSIAAAGGVTDVIRRVGAQGGAVPVSQVLARTGLNTIPGLQNAARALNLDPAAIEAAAAARAGGPPADLAAVLRRALAHYGLPEAEAAGASDLLQRYTTAAELQRPKMWGDSLLNLTKAGLYSIWPSSHVRNFGSGVFESAMEGTKPWSPAYRDAEQLLSGQGIETGLQHLAGQAPDQQRLRLLEEMFGQGIIGSPQGELLQRVGIPEHSIGAGNPSLPRMTGSVGGDLAQVGGQLRQGLGTPEGRDLLGVAGVGARAEDTNAFVRAGRAAGANVEDRLRVAQYLDLRRQGYVPEAAKAAVEHAHFNYQNLSDFEKQYMKRIFPFYTFSRQNVPKQFGRAAESPLKVGIPTRVAGGSDEEGYVPEYLRSGLALPVGSPQDGTQRYLSQLGLPFEEAFNRLKVGGTLPETISKTLLGLLGSTRGDFIQNPLEFATGKDFFTGRNLADLHVGKVESLGGMLDEDTAGLLSQALQGTPPARMVSTLNRLLDERKYANGLVPGLATNALSLATGAKLTDVDTEKWKAIDARNALEKLLQGDQRIRESKDYFLPRELQPTVTPEETVMLRLQASLKARAREAAAAKLVGVQMGR